MKAKTNNNAPEFSRPLSTDKIPPSGMEQVITAKDAERQKLTERLGLLDLPKLEATLTVVRAQAGYAFAVTGKIKADIVQQCVVTLEPLPKALEMEVHVLYAGPENELGAGPADLDEDDVEFIQDGQIDLGELVTQNLAIAMDPYPRKEGVSPVEMVYGESAPEMKPMAKLMELAKKGKNS